LTSHCKNVSNVFHDLKKGENSPNKFKILSIMTNFGYIL
jgi:hypothetical protein